VYERPASVFVADFIGSPSMNFLPFDGGYAAGADQVRIGDDAVLPIPALREDARGDKLLLGVRPEHVRLSAASALRAEVLGTEYLGTSQVVTCTTTQGATVRAKVGVDLPVQRGDAVGLAFDAWQVSLFDQASGRALRTARHDDAMPVRRGPRAGAASLATTGAARG
jgi:multiple sugar transport system ATP-binding protein